MSGATEVLIQKELLNVMAENLAAKVISSSLREVAGIDLQEEGVSVVAHKVDEAKKENSAVKFVPDFAIELESVRGATEVLVREEILNVIADDLAAEAIANSLRELESASFVEDIASEAEKTIPGVTCELTGNVIELESEDPEVHESVKETLSDVPSEDDKLSSKACECTLEWETVSAVQPEIVVEFENVTAVTEIHSQEEVVSVVAHEVGEAKKKNSAVKLVSDFAIELESVRGATGVLVREELLNVIAKDLTVEVITSSLRELESASLVEDIASEAEKIIPGVTCELTDNVIELESEDPKVHQSAKKTLSDVPSEDAKLSNKVHECTLEWETVSAVQPEIAMEFENITAVTEIHSQEEVVSVVAHEFGEAKKKNSAVKLVSDFAIELESVRGATEVQVQEELINVTAEDLAAEAITRSLTELESASLVEDIASEAEKTISGVTCELTDSVIEPEFEDPEVHESVKETLSDVPSEDDKLSNKVHDCTSEWETVGAVQPEIAMEFENITAVTEIHSQEEVVSVVAYEFGEAKKENSAVKLVSDFAIELESVRGATEVHVQEELINVTAEDLVAEAITRSLTELESASLVEDIASEAEKTISGVTCELTDSVIEPEFEDPEVHESVKETLSDVPSEDDKLSNKAYECTLEWKTDSAIQPEIAVEFENVTAATEMCLQQEVVPVVAHEASEAKKENSAVKIVSDFAIELESVRGATEVQIQEELLNVIAEDLTAEVITSSLRELESLALAEDIAPEAETIQAVVCELTDSVIELESEDVVLDEVSQTSVDILVDKLSGTVEGSECMLGWETVGVIESEVAAEFEGVTEVPDILVQEKIIPSVVHESSAAEVKLDLSFEPQSVTAAIDFPLEQRNSTRITRESVLPKSDSAREFFPECSLLMEYGSDVSVISNEVAAAEVKTSCTFWPESSLDLKSVSEVVQSSLEIDTRAIYTRKNKTRLK